jgi:DNA-binding MarR family transcriptional regulator
MPSPDAGVEPDDRAQDVAAAVLRLSAVVHRYRSIVGRGRYGLDATATLTIVGLYMHGPMTPTELAAMANLTPPATTELLDRLDRAGYIQRNPHPKDRRKLLISPTSMANNVGHRELGEFTELIRYALTASGGDDPGNILAMLLTAVRAVEEATEQLPSGPSSR